MASRLRVSSLGGHSHRDSAWLLSPEPCWHAEPACGFDPQRTVAHTPFITPMMRSPRRGESAYVGPKNTGSDRRRPPASPLAMGWPYRVRECSVKRSVIACANGLSRGTPWRVFDDSGFAQQQQVIRVRD